MVGVQVTGASAISRLDFSHVRQLSNLSAFLLYLADAGNDRLTINQAAFFLLAGTADLRGSPRTLSEIMEAADTALTKSLKTTYKVLLGPTPQYRDLALGWLYREIDEDDQRRKYLRLTEKGRKVLTAALLVSGKGSQGH